MFNVQYKVSNLHGIVTIFGGRGVGLARMALELRGSLLCCAAVTLVLDSDFVTSSHIVALYDEQGVLANYSNPKPHEMGMS